MTEHTIEMSDTTSSTTVVTQPSSSLGVDSLTEIIGKSGDAYLLLSKLVEAAEKKLKSQQDLLQILQSFRL
jgi:hypothetical protein